MLAPPVELYGTLPYSNISMVDFLAQVDSDSGEEESGSDIQSGPRKRRKGLVSNSGIYIKSLTPVLKTSIIIYIDANYMLVSKQPTPSGQSLTESESEPDAYGGSRRRLQSKKHRRVLQSAHRPSSSHGEVRFSTRKAAKVSTYNEDDDDIFSDEQDLLTPGYWPAGPEENLPAIDVVLDHRLREDTSKYTHSNFVCLEPI